MYRRSSFNIMVAEGGFSESGCVVTESCVRRGQWSYDSRASGAGLTKKAEP